MPSIFKQIYILPLASYVLATAYFFLVNPITANTAVLLANSLFAALLIFHPWAFCQCQYISFMLFCSRVIKEFMGIALPSDIEIDSLNELFINFSLWIFEAAFWLLVLMLAIIVLLQIANTLSDSDLDAGASSPTLPSAKIIELPTLQFSNYQEKMQINQSCVENECSICLEAFESQDNINTLHNCQHIYHPECIKKWLIEHKNCPYCRTDVYKKDAVINIDDEEGIQAAQENNSDLNNFIVATGFSFSLLPTI